MKPGDGGPPEPAGGEERSQVPQPAARPSRRRRAAARFLRHANIVALLAVIATAGGLLLSPSDDEALLGLPDLAAGERSPRTVKSSRDFTIADPVTTDRLRQEAAEHVLPVYDLVGGLGAAAKGRIEDAFLVMAPPSAHADAGVPSEGALQRLYKDRSEDFMRALDVFFDEKDLDVLFHAGFADEIRDGAIMAVRTIYEHDIVDDKELFRLQAPDGIQVRILSATGLADKEQMLFDYQEVIGVDQARAQIDQIIARKLTHLGADPRRAVAAIVKRMVRPNLLPNRGETDARAAAARGAVRSVVIPIKAGETILHAGEQVNERHLLILRGMASELEGKSRFGGPVGTAALIVLIVLGSYNLYRRRRRDVLPLHRELALWASVYLGTLLISWIGYQGVILLGDYLPNPESPLYRYGVPVAWSTLLLRVVMGAEVAGAFVPLAALTCGWMMSTSLGYTAYVLVGCLAAAAVRDGERPRSTLTIGALWIALMQSAAVLALGLMESPFTPAAAMTALGAAVSSGVLSAILAAALIPAIEVLLGFTTPFRLADLANLNHPLLRDLLVQAPGTYHHSIVVGALAEAGAKAIGADALLARVGGYYHDIGKIKNPRNYSENDRGAMVGGSPADQAAEIKLHVAEGLELGAKHRLGDVILEVIAQHHGTGSVRRLRMRAVEYAGGALTAAEELAFAYAGPKPLSREAALVLLADAAESATEDLVSDAPLEQGAIDTTVRRVVSELLASGQLDECDLTLRDLRAVSEAFAYELREMLMRRGRSVPSQLPHVAAPLPVRPPPFDRPN